VRLPVEVVGFGWQATVRHLERAGAEGQLRRDPAGAPFQTDNGNLIVDCAFAIPDPAALHARLSLIPGVVETGLFIGMAHRVIAGTASGPRILDRT
jgi:ribose 5-phosphate isomerase A